MEGFTIISSPCFLKICAPATLQQHAFPMFSDTCVSEASADVPFRASLAPLGGERGAARRVWRCALCRRRSVRVHTGVPPLRSRRSCQDQPWLLATRRPFPVLCGPGRTPPSPASSGTIYLGHCRTRQGGALSHESTPLRTPTTSHPVAGVTEHAVAPSPGGGEEAPD